MCTPHLPCPFALQAKQRKIDELVEEMALRVDAITREMNTKVSALKNEMYERVTALDIAISTRDESVAGAG